ncbi:MAG: hypothetical protein WB501_00515 [Nitrososphaeraceae archaeon]
MNSRKFGSKFCVNNKYGSIPHTCTHVKLGMKTLHDKNVTDSIEETEYFHEAISINICII